MRAALGRYERMNLIEDDCFHAPQALLGIGREHQEERLRCRDQDVGGRPLKPRPFRRRRVARPYQNGGHVEGPPGSRGDLRDTGQRQPKVALDVHGERLERRHVQHPAPAHSVGHWFEHQTVE